MPAQPRARYKYIQSLERSGLPFPVMLLTYSSGNNTGNLHFVWKVPVENAAEECLQSSLAAIEQVKLLMAQFHTRATRQAMFEKFGRVSPGVKPAVLRLFYKDPTGDCSASHDLPESVGDGHVCKILTMEPEDPNTVVDLREVKNKDSRTKFEDFGVKPRSI